MNRRAWVVAFATWAVGCGDRTLIAEEPLGAAELRVIAGFGEGDAERFVVALPASEPFVLDWSRFDAASFQLWIFPYTVDGLAAEFPGFRRQSPAAVAAALAPSFAPDGFPPPAASSVLVGDVRRGSSGRFSYALSDWGRWERERTPTRPAFRVHPPASDRCPDAGTPYLVFDLDDPHRSLEMFWDTDCQGRFHFDSELGFGAAICPELIGDVELLTSGRLRLGAEECATLAPPTPGTERAWRCPMSACWQDAPCPSTLCPGRTELRLGGRAHISARWPLTVVSDLELPAATGRRFVFGGDLGVALSLSGHQLLLDEIRPAGVGLRAEAIVRARVALSGQARLTADPGLTRLVVSTTTGVALVARTGEIADVTSRLPALAGEAVHGRDRVFVPTRAGLKLLDPVTLELADALDAAEPPPGTFLRATVVTTEAGDERLVLCPGLVAGGPVCLGGATVEIYDPAGRRLESFAPAMPVVAILPGPRFVTQAPGSALIQVTGARGASQTYALPVLGEPPASPSPRSLPRDAYANATGRPSLLFTTHRILGLVDLETGAFTHHGAWGTTLAPLEVVGVLGGSTPRALVRAPEKADALFVVELPVGPPPG